MLRTLQYGLLRNITTYLWKKTSINTTGRHPKSFISLGFKVLVGSQVCCAALKAEKRTKIDVEDSLRKACEEGDTAIILLMDTLKDFILIVCQEYRSCLTKQIEITKTASKIGPLTEIWDELPQYRTLAADLNKELDDYMTVFNTIGQMTNDDSLKMFVKGTTDKLHLIAVKYSELDTLLQKQIAENKEVELSLLKIKRDSILDGVN